MKRFLIEGVFMKIMFVCTGNICRSAMAEKMLKNKIQDKRDLHIQVFSSGISAYNGDTPTYEALKVMREEYGIDMTAHKATHVSCSNIEEMDKILCMTNSHKRTLIAMYPQISDRIYTIKEYVGLEGDVLDPYGGTIEVYHHCAKQLDEYTTLIIEKEESV